MTTLDKRVLAASTLLMLPAAVLLCRKAVARLLLKATDWYDDQITGQAWARWD
jgi:hypothetical protein